MRALLDHVEADFTRVSGLHLNLDAVQGPLELLVGARVRHLAPHLCGVRGPFEFRHRAPRKQAINKPLVDVS